VLYGNVSNAIALGYLKTRGASPTTHVALQFADDITLNFAYGSDGTGFIPSAFWGFYVDGAVSTGVVPVGVHFATGTGGYGIERVTIGSNGNFNVLSGVIVIKSNAVLTAPAAATLQFGNVDIGAVPIAQTIQVQSVVAGTSNTAGADFTIQGSRGTGTGAGGKIVFKTAPAGTTGTSQNAATSKLTINGAGQVVVGGFDPPVLDINALFFTSCDSTVKWNQVANAMGNSANGCTIVVSKTRGATPTTNVALQTADGIGGMLAFANDGTNYIATSFWQFEVDGAVSTGSVPTAMSWWTGSTGYGVKRLGLSSSGQFKTFAGIASTNTTTGDLVITGGVGIGGDINIAGNFGGPDAAAPGAVTIKVQSVVAGTSNTAGADFTIQGSRGTGTGVGGAIVLRTAPAGGSGTSQNAAVDRMRIDGAGRITAGATAADGIGLSFLFRSLTANVGYTNNNSVQQWFPTTGAVAVEASTSYEFEGQLLQTNGTTSHTVAISFAGTATLTSIEYVSWFAPSLVNATITTGNTTQVNQAAATIVTPAITTAGTVIQIRGIVRINAAGTLIPQFTFSAAPGAGNTLANTFFKLRKIGNDTNTAQGTWT
jgi:hypothetical protein